MFNSGRTRADDVQAWLCSVQAKKTQYDAINAIIRRLKGGNKVSHAVRRGDPTAAQLYLDSILDEVLEAKARRPTEGRKGLNLAEVIYHCMRKWPDSTRLINGSTGESFTNEQILHRAIPIALALRSMGASGRVAMVVMRNHEDLVAVYYGALFAGVTLMMLEPASTEFELQHFMELAKPVLVFYDEDRYEAVTGAVDAVRGAAGAASAAGGAARDVRWPLSIKLVSGDALATFVEGTESQLQRDGFEVSDVSSHEPAVLLPTSGSTGLPKATVITHGALIAQLPSLWTYESRFPRPTECGMFLSTAQWMTHTNMLTTCPVFNITCLTSPKTDHQHALSMIETYKPTFFLGAPGLARMVAVEGAPAQLASLRTVVITGSAPAHTTLTTYQEKLPAGTRVCNGYGMTEMQGFVSLPAPSSSHGSIGKVFNIFDYKFIDEDQNEVAPSQGGELILQSECVIKAYLGDREAHAASLTRAGGWWLTGDVIREDEHGDLFYIERKKFWFKYQNYQVSPEELEQLIMSVPGVLECAVGGTERGAATAVIARPGATVTRDQIHAVINSKLIEYKRLHGGIAFVTALPRTHSGKLHRRACADLLAKLVASGQCC